MMRKLIPLISCIVFGCGSTSEKNQVTFQVRSPSPFNTGNTEIYVAGNFNGWNPKDSSYLMTYKEDGLFELNKALPSNLKGNLEYKYTRGSWETVEANGNGGNISNRIAKYKGGSLTVKDAILAWDLKPPSSTATANVQIFRKEIEIPQLGRLRRVWVYLPSDYEDNATMRYPVIYMHDGQNLFDNLIAPFGEWQVDETLNKFESEYHFSAIIVGIDNNDSLRLNEYSPYTHPKYGGGEGNKYLDFIAETLKPSIDKEFRTLPDRENTAIAGSSMGGLISFCAGIRHPNVFSKLFVFSPSFWFNDQVYIDAEQLGKAPTTSIYLLVGAEEGPQMVNGTKKMQAVLEQTGSFTKDNFETSIVAGGNHNEAFWSHQFPTALKWMFHLKE